MEVFLTEMFFLDATNPVSPTQWMNLPFMMLISLSKDILYTISLSIYISREVNYTTSSFNLLGKNWTVREATSSEYEVPEENSTEHFYRPLYLIAPDCRPGQTPVEM